MSKDELEGGGRKDLKERKLNTANSEKFRHLRSKVKSVVCAAEHYLEMDLLVCTVSINTPAQ